MKCTVVISSSSPLPLSFPLSPPPPPPPLFRLSDELSCSMQRQSPTNLSPSSRPRSVIHTCTKNKLYLFTSKKAHNVLAFLKVELAFKILTNESLIFVVPT